MARPIRYCTVDGCSERRASNGLCSMHAQRMAKWGNPLYRAQFARREELIEFVREAVALLEGEGCITTWPDNMARATRGHQHDWTHVALELDGRPRPPVGEPRFALHSCDNPLCYNPRHLRWGTQAENMRDAADRDRSANLRFSDEDIRTIRERLARGDLQRNIAADYGVHQATISKIKRGIRGEKSH